ncbi:MAG TPA: D-2-hydroxyacid dehydrogenase [Streptosporangiaceae bacterium]
MAENGSADNIRTDNKGTSPAHGASGTRGAARGRTGDCVVAIAGASPDAPPPGLSAGLPGCDIRFIPARERLASDAADAEIVFAWEPWTGGLRESWGFTPNLRWIAAATVGVDWLLFPELAGSDVIVTNSAGVFDAAMAEYTLALVSAICADLHTTIRLQTRREWQHRETTRLAGRRAIVLGAGGIGRAINRALDRAGVIPKCVGRHSRVDPELGRIAALDELPGLLPEADFVILALPLTVHTKGLFGASEFSLMRPGSWLINLGRGALVDDQELIRALRNGAIGGAALDVFTQEPLPPDSPLWDLPNAIISRHMSGDFRGWDRALAGLFLAQLRRYRSGEPLINVVDKSLGYVPGS